MKLLKIIFFIIFSGHVIVGSAQLDASFSSPDVDQCPNNLFTLNATNATYSTYNWSITGPGGYSSTPSGSSVALYLTTPGQYSVTLTVSNGGPSATSPVSFLTVYSNPTISYLLTPTTGCTPLNVSFIGSGSGIIPPTTPGSGSLQSFQITTGAGNTFNVEDFSYTYTSPGTFTPTATVTNSFGCFTSQNLSTITVNQSASLSSPLNPNSICSGSTFNYTPTSSTAGCTYSWSRATNAGIVQGASSGNGNISEALTLVNPNGSNVPVTYIVTTTAPNGCQTQQNVIVTVKALPTVTINPSSLSICNGQTGTLTATGTPAGGTYSWSGGLGSAATATVSAAGSYSVTYSSSGCASSAVSANVIVTTAPTVSITVSESSGIANNDGSICAGASVTLNAVPSGGVGTYSWSNGASTQSITVSPSATTSYSVTYTSGCPSSPTSQQITVNSLPGNSYTTGTSNACSAPVTTVYNSTSTNAASGTTWLFPGGTPNSGSGSGPLTVSYNTAGNYSITMTSTSVDGCVATNTFPNAIVVGNGVAPTSSMTTSTAMSQCFNGNNFCFTYTGTGADTLRIDWGDGSPLQFFDQNASFCHNFGSVGTFTVTMIPFKTSGTALTCSGTASQMTVTVTGPKASFTPSTVSCDNQLNRTFTNTTSGTSGITVTYSWDFGDPTSGANNTSTLTSPSHTFSAYSSTAYTVTLTATGNNGCTSTATASINCFPNNLANYQVYNCWPASATCTPVVTNAVCLGGTLSFVNTTPSPQITPGTLSSSTTTQWDWNASNGLQWQTGSFFRGSPRSLVFGETSATNTGNIAWTPGVYTVSMRNRRDNGSTICYDTIQKTITIHGITGTFSIADTVCTGAVISPSDNSAAPVTSIVSRVWQWGDGTPNTIGNNANPTHTYTTSGTYTITLTVTDAFGCTKTTTKNVVVRKPIASFAVNRNYVCNNQTVVVTNNSTGPGLTSYAWSATSATPATASGSSFGTFTFNSQGNQSITLTVTDNLGCTDDTTIAISVFDVFAAASASQTNFSCFNPPNLVNFTNLSTNNVDNTSASWNFGNGQTSNLWNPSTTYSAAGTYNVTLTVSSLTGCTSTQTVATITVGGPSGTLDVTNASLTGCTCYNATFSVTTGSVTEAKLLYGDGGFVNLTPNSNQTLNYSYCNTGTTPVSFTPSLYISNGTCNGFITSSETITINPKPAITAMTNTVCSGVAFTSTPANGTNGVVPSGTTYSWSAPTVTGGITGGASGTNASSISGTLTNPTNTAQTATYTVTPTSGSCSGSTFTVTVTVNPKPAITAMTNTVCSGVAFTSTPANGTNGVVPSGTTYSWSAPTVTGGITGGASGTNASSISGTLTNPTNTAQTATYTVTPTSGSCSGSTFTVTVTVNPKPVITAMTNTVCSGVAFTSTPANGTNGVVPSGTTYSWSAPTVTGGITGGASGTNASSISGTLTNPTNTAQTATYTVTPTSGSCSGSTFTVTVTVNPKPAITAMTNTVCSGVAFTSTPANGTNGVVPSGTTYSWSAPTVTGGITGGASGTNASSISGTLTNPTNTAQTATYTVTPTSGSCSGSTFTVTVTVNPKPAITAMTNTVCSGVAFTSTPANGTNGVVPSGTTYSWSAPTVTGGITGGASGTNASSISGTLTNPTNTAQTATYTVTPTSGSCSGSTFTVTVTVNPNPAITTMTNTVCSGVAFTSTPANGTNGVVPSGTTYSWSAPTVTGGITGGASGTNASSISGTLTNPTNTAQTATYTVTPTSGSCSGSTFTVTVTVNPKPAITAMTNTVCSGVAFTSTPANGTNGVVPSGTTYSWSAPTVTGGITGGASGTNASSISGTLTNPTNTAQTATYTVTPTSGSCSGSTFTVTVTVNPNPAITAMTNTVCSGVAFTSTPANGTNGVVPSGTTYSWSAPTVTGGITGGASGTNASSISGTLTNPTNTAQTATYTVTPTSGSCSGSTFTVTVTVNPNPAITTMTNTVCSGVAFTSTPANGTNGVVPSGTTYSWSAPTVTGGITGGASGTNASSISGTLTNPTNTAQTATYTVTPTSGSCSGSTFTVTVTVNPKPAITAMTNTVCSGVAFTSTPANGTNGVVPSGTTYSWSAPTVTGGITGGASGTNASSISGTLTNPTNTAQTATYTVTPTSGSCSGSTFTVTVTVNPIITFTASSTNPTVCNATDGTITLTGLQANTTYAYSLNGGATVPATSNGSGQIVITGLAATTYTITVTNPTTNCASSSQNVSLTSPGSPDVNDNTDQVLCGGSYTLPTITGTNLTGSNPSYYTGPNGTGTTLTVGSSISTTQTVYIFATTPGGCSDQETFTVTINSLPTISGALSVCIGLTTQLTGSGTPNATAPWASASTGVATVSSTGLVSGVAQGTSVITYKDINGCQITATVTVNSLPTFTMAFTNPTVCNGTNGTITLGGLQSNSNYTYTLNGGSANASTSNSTGQIAISNLSAGSYVVELTLVSSGCQSTTQTVSLINPNSPDVNDITDQLLCGGSYTLPAITGTNLTGSNPLFYTGPNGTGSSIAVGSIINTNQTIYIYAATPGGCSDQESFTVTINQAATSNAGIDQTICSNGSATLAGAIGGGASSGTWSGGTGTYNPNATTLNAVYTPSASEITSGTVTLTLTTDDPAGPCNVATDQVVITINSNPTVNAGIDQTICASGTVTLAGVIGGGASSATWSGGTGTYNPNATTLNAVYTPSSAELTAGTVTLTLTTNDPTGPCNSISDQVLITINLNTTANAGLDQTICSNGTVTLAGVIGGGATSGSWSGGTGTYNPNATTLNAVYTPSASELAAGTVTLTLTTDDPAGPCASATDQVVITINSNPTVNAGIDQTICASGTVTLAGVIGGGASSATWSGGTGTYNPNATTLNAVYTPSSAELTAGTVTLTLTTNDPTGPCNSISDQVLITINLNTTANAGLDQTICSNGTVTLAGVIGGAATSGSWSGGTGTYNPNATTLNAVYTPSASEITSGTVTLTLTTDDPAGPCNVATDQVVITINSNPTVNAGIDQTICASGTVTLAGVIGGGASSATWSGGTGTYNPNATTLNAVYTPSSAELTAGTVTLTLTTNDPTGPCNSISDQVLITINLNTTANAGLDQTICSNGTVTLAGVIGGAATSGSWSGGTGTYNPNATTLNAVYTPSASELTSGTVTLTLTTDDPAGPCNVATDQVVITINSNPTVNAGVDQTICASGTVTLAGVIGGGASSATWSGGTGTYNPNATTLNAVYTPSSAELTAGTVTLTLTTNDPTGPCNSISDQVLITINQLAVVNAGGDQVICSSNSLSLNGTIGGATTSAIWTSSGSGTFTPSNTTLNATYNPSAADITTGFIQMTLTSDDPSGPCSSVNSLFNLSINLTPTANAGADFVSCSNVPVQLNGTIGGGASSLTWTGNGSFNNASLSNAQYTPTALELSSGTATLTITTNDPAGPCNAATDQVVVTFTIPATANAGADQTICQGTNAILNGSFGGAATSATWTTSGSGTFSPNANTISATYIPSNADISAGSVILTLTTNDPAGPCGPVNDLMVLTINPAPTANNLPVIAICSGQSVNVQLPNTPTFSYTWIANDNSNTSGESLALQSTSLINDVILNNSAVDQQVVYQITPTNTVTGCLGQTFNYTITVRPVATATQQANQTICVPNSTNAVIFTGTPAGTTYTWANNQISIGLLASGNGNIASFTPTNSGSTIVTATITVTPIYQSCPGTPMIFDYNVIPTLTVDQILNDTLCGGEIYPGAIFTGNAPGVTYIWQNNNTSISSPVVVPGLGSGDIASFTTSNTGSLLQDATITVTPTLAGCPNGTPMTFHIVVRPVPNVFVNPSSQNVCHNNASQFVDFYGNLDGFATYQWSHDNISIGLGTPGFNDIPPFTVTNTGNTPQTSNFTVFATYNGCTGPNTNFTITANPVPIIVATPDQQLCGNTLTNPVTFTSVNNVAGSVYNWTNSSPTIGLPATGAGNIGGIVVPDSLQTTLISQFEVTPSFNGCNGASDIFTFTVLPVPLVYPLASQGDCSGSPTNPVIITGSHDPSAIYTWNNDNTIIGISGPNSGNIPSFTLVGVPNTTTVSTVTVTPQLTTNGQICIGIPQTFTITAVDPIPDIYPIPDTVLCSGQTFNQHVFAGTISNPNVNYNWQNNETASGLSSNGINSISTQVLTNNTLADIVSQITVTPTDGFCSGTPETFTITVKPRPDLFLSQYWDSLCAGNQTDLILFSSSLPGTTYSWVGTTNIGYSPNNGTGGSIAPVIGVNSGNTPLTDSIFVSSFNNGCSGDIDTLTITVNPSTIVSTSFPSYFFCSGTSINIPFNGSVLGSNYTWINDNTSTGIASSGTSSSLSTTVINNSYVDQTSTITVTPIFNGCPGQTYSFTVTVGPIPNVYSLSDITLCANTNTPLIDFQGDYASADFNWTNTNISIADGGVLSQSGTGDINPFLTYNTSGITQIDSVFVTPVLNSCQGSVDTLLITVYPVTQVITNDISVCSGTVIPTTCFSGSLAGVSYNWTSDNVGIGMDGAGVDCIPTFISNTATTVQTATISVTPLYNGCPGIVGTMQIEVRPVPIINPNSNSNMTYCDNEFADSIYFTSNISSNYTWTNNNISIGLGANGDGNLDSYLASNDFLAQQIDLNAEITVTPVAFGCTGSSSIFTITVHPLPIVEAGIDTFLCFNQCLTLNATGTALTYIWDNGGLQGQQYCPTSSIMMQVTGTDANQCQNTDSYFIEYSTELPPIVSAGPDSAICFGETYTLTAIGNADLYEWNNQVIDGEPFTPNQTNTYVVIATDISNGCISSDTMELVVHPLPIVTANTLDSVLCDGEQALLWGEGAMTYVWNNGISDSVWFTPTVSDTYTVIGYDQYGCTDTVDISMVVNPLPQVLFSSDMNYGGCLDFRPTFTDLTGANGNGPTSASVTWYFGNNTTSNQLGSVTNIYDDYGCYDITLVSTTAEGCTDSLTQQDYVCVNEIIASFEPDVTEQLISNPSFEFQNTSVNATSYQWFFGDGTESDFVNTIHTYDSIGYYQVVLVAYAQDGCTDTAVVVVKVNDQLIIYVPNAFTPDGDGLNDVFLPILTAGYKPGTYEFSIYNRWGERIFYTEDENEGWDGTYRGNNVQIGTYTYSIKFKDSMNNKVYTFNGRVSLIR